jgi:hypothetical protein
MSRTCVCGLCHLALRTLLALISCCVLALPLLSQAPPSADTFVTSALPQTNFGSGISVLVAGGDDQLPAI